MSTQSLSKKLLVSAVVALPFPYLLLIVAQFAAALPNELSASAFLSSDQGANFYIVAWLIFLAASLIATIAVGGSKSSSGSSHYSDVRFDLSDGEKGKQADNVSVVK